MYQAWHFASCEHWSFSKNNQLSICLGINFDLLLKPDSKRVLNLRCLTLYEPEKVIGFQDNEKRLCPPSWSGRKKKLARRGMITVGIDPRINTWYSGQTSLSTKTFKSIFKALSWLYWLYWLIALVVISGFDKYHLILRVLFSCFKPPTVITSLARSLAQLLRWEV